MQRKNVDNWSYTRMEMLSVDTLWKSWSIGVSKSGRQIDKPVTTRIIAHGKLSATAHRIGIFLPPTSATGPTVH